MPRYYFHARSRSLLPDDVGTELSSRYIIPDAVKELLPAIAKEAAGQSGDSEIYSVLVHDEHGTAVYAATLSYAGLWLDRPAVTGAADRHATGNDLNGFAQAGQTEVDEDRAMDEAIRVIHGLA